MTSATPDQKTPDAPALPDSGRLPHVAYQPVLTGQPALVTGANSGIGRAVALGLARAGADVVVNYVAGPDAAEAVVNEIKALGRKAVALQADVSKEEDVERMFAAAIRAFGTLHIVVSNAGLQRDAAFDAMTMEQWSTVIGVNLTGQFLCTAGRGARVSHAPGRGGGRVAGGGQAHLHELGPPDHPLGRARELCRVEGRDRHADAERGAGGGPALHPGERDRARRDPHAH